MRKRIPIASPASCCARPSSARSTEIENGFLECAAALLSRPLRRLSRACCRGEERAQPIDAYFRRILDPDPAVHGPAARAWDETERILSEHTPNRARLDLPALNSSRALPATPFMEAHYFANDCFMTAEPVDAPKPASSKAFPASSCRAATICCVRPRPRTRLARVWREAEIRFVEGAGHTLYDPGVRDAVMKAIADMASRTSK